MKILITGGCGFLGSNLASFGIKNGYDITVLDNLSRFGASDNLKWLKQQGDFNYICADVRNSNDVENAIMNKDYDAIFHLAGQVAMTTSIDNPRKDFEINTLGTFNVLDTVRKYSPDTAIFYSSTNKVYGDLKQYKYIETDKRYICDEFPQGFNENIALDFRSPYGCSKGAAEQYLKDFSNIYGLKTVVFRHSSMYGGRQFATYDQGWIGWFCAKAIELYKNKNAKEFTISGNGKQVRDILHAEDMINLYYSSLKNINVTKGQIYNIGGGIDNSLSLLELFDLLNETLGINLKYTQLPPRCSDQKVFVADISKITKDINWKPAVSKEEGIKKMLNWVEEI